MGNPRNDRKRDQSANRYNFEQPDFENSWQDWQDTNSQISTSPHAQGQNAQEWHQPAPMNKRVDAAAKPKRKRKVGRGSWSTVIFFAALGLAGFAFVIAFTGGGKFWNLILPTPAAAPRIANTELPAPPQPRMVEPAEPIALSTQIVEKTETVAPQIAAVAEPKDPPEAIPLSETELVAPAVVASALMQEPKARGATDTAQILQGQIVQDCNDCPELIAVSAGKFSPINGSAAIDFQKAISIEYDFAIGRNAITFDDWDKCVSDGACDPIANDASWGRGDRPLIFVSYDDVISQYLPWLSKLTGHEYRLPSKDEWQYAALGGENTSSAKATQISSVSQDCFNASGPASEGCTDNYDGTSPVGSFAPNMLGLNDMKGNVWAWSADCWQPFSNAPSAKSEACEMRVLLGGAWSTKRNDVSIAFSGWEKSSRKANSIGFRVVRKLP